MTERKKAIKEKKEGSRDEENKGEENKNTRERKLRETGELLQEEEQVGEDESTCHG